MQPLKSEQRRTRKKEALAEIAESGLRLQTPQNSYQAPFMGYIGQEMVSHPAVYRNSMLVLNPEPAYRGTMKCERDRKLATRHGFPNPVPNMHLYEVPGKAPPSRQGPDRWGIHVRHSISSQVHPTSA